MTSEATERWTSILSTFDESEAAILRGLLESEGIPCRVDTTRVSQLPVSVGELGEFIVLVRVSDYERAARVLEVARAESSDMGE